MAGPFIAQSQDQFIYLPLCLGDFTKLSIPILSIRADIHISSYDTVMSCLDIPYTLYTVAVI